MKDSRCVVIGIANALDLTQRFLPRLQTKNCMFLGSILELNSSRSTTVSPLRTVRRQANHRHSQATLGETAYLLPRRAISHDSKFRRGALCSKGRSYRGSSQGPGFVSVGDLRLMERTHVRSRQCIEVAEQEYRRIQSRPVLASTASPTPKASGIAAASSVAFPKVTLVHAMKVVNSVFGSSNPTASKIKMLNVQQKFVLTIATLVEKNNRDPKAAVRIQMSIGKLYDVYLQVCSGKNNVLDAISHTEFLVLVSAMETTGIIHFGKSNGTSFGTPNRQGAGGFGGRMGTPTSGGFGQKGVRKTPVSSGKFGTPNKGSGIDIGSLVILTADENDLALGIQDVPFLKEFLVQGLPLSVIDP